MNKFLKPNGETKLMTKFAYVVLAILLTHGSTNAESGPKLPACSVDIQSLVAAALEHSLVTAKDFPDIALIKDDNPILVKNEISKLECKIENNTLPNSPDFSFLMLSQRELNERANEHGPINYVEIKNVYTINDLRTAVSLELSMLFAENKYAPLCCCFGDAVFGHVEDEWIFREWTWQGCS